MADDGQTAATTTPASESGDGHRGLPRGPTSLVGRGQVLRDLLELEQGSRLVTLTGPPGIGKTRLGLVLAARIRGDRPVGVCLVELATVCRESRVPGAVAAALSIPEQPGRGMHEALVARLSGQRTVILLNDCEQLLGACARLVEALLGDRAGPTFIATSREPLALAAETVYRVPPLSVPASAPAGPAAELLEYGAVALFVERVRAVVPGFELTGYVAPAVAEICRRLDGIPLAIELAAARTDTLTPAEIAGRLDARFDLLRATAATPGRHRSLQAALDCSHELLREPERALLRRLSVFAESCDLQAARAVCSGDGVDEADLRGLLSALVSKSLVSADTQSGPRTRYGLPQTIAAYASDRLQESGEAASLRERHADLYLALAETAEAQLTGARQMRWLERLDAERANLRRAFEWSLGRGDAERALRLATALVLFWRVRCHFDEGREMLSAALGAGCTATPALRAKALWGAGFMTFMAGDVEQATPLLEESASCLRALGDAGGCARALLVLGNRMQYRDDGRSLSLLQESAELAREAGDLWCLSHALGIAGRQCASFSRLSDARPLLEECLEVAGRAQDAQGLRLGLLGLGSVLVRQGDHRRAGSLLAEAVSLALQLGEDYSRATALEYLAELAICRGDYAGARALLEEVLVLLEDVGHPMAPSEPFALLAQVQRALGDDRAARLSCERALAHRGPGMSLCAIVVLGDLTAAEGDPQTARGLYHEALALDLCGGENAARALHGLALLARLAGAEGPAVALHHEALVIQAEIGAVAQIVASLEALAGAECHAGAHERAARFFGAAHAQRAAHGYARPPWESARYETDVGLVRSALGTAAFARAFGEGAELSIERVLAEIGTPAGLRGRPGSGWRSLTERERQVAALAADSLTNPRSPSACRWPRPRSSATLRTSTPSSAWRSAASSRARSASGTVATPASRRAVPRGPPGGTASAAAGSRSTPARPSLRDHPAVSARRCRHATRACSGRPAPAMLDLAEDGPNRSMGTDLRAR